MGTRTKGSLLLPSPAHICYIVLEKQGFLVHHGNSLGPSPGVEVRTLISSPRPPLTPGQGRAVLRWGPLPASPGRFPSPAPPASSVTPGSRGGHSLIIRSKREYSPSLNPPLALICHRLLSAPQARQRHRSRPLPLTALPPSSAPPPPPGQRRCCCCRHFHPGARYPHPPFSNAASARSGAASAREAAHCVRFVNPTTHPAVTIATARSSSALYSRELRPWLENLRKRRPRGVEAALDFTSGKAEGRLLK